MKHVARPAVTARPERTFGTLPAEGIVDPFFNDQGPASGTLAAVGPVRLPALGPVRPTFEA